MPALRTRDIHSRALEVSTDVNTETPSLSIISPTPRAFTFPVNHNLDVSHTPSPYSTPSHSPANHAAAYQTPPPLFRTLTPVPKHESPSPGPSRHRRRKSSASSEMLHERRPKKGDDDYIKRPENAFILFRRSATSAVNPSPTTGRKQRQADLSKTISQQWKTLPAEERKHWEDLAKEKKKEHEERYPDYVYRPQRVKARGSSKGKARKDSMEYEPSSQGEQPSISFSVPLNSFSETSTTPASYQQLSVPDVYNGGACSSEVSLLPLIARRTSYAGGDCDDSFDYIPQNVSNTLMPPPQFQDSSAFMQGMFNQDPAKTASLGVDIPDHHYLGHQLEQQPSAISPASSINSSPQTGPYTPTYGFNPRPDQQVDWASCMPTEPMDYDMQMGIQLQQEVDYSQFTNFSWGASSESTWNTDPVTWNGDADFDLSAIPPIELGVSSQEDDPSQLIYLPEQPESVEVDEGGKGYHYVPQQPFEGENGAEGAFGQQQMYGYSYTAEASDN